jgi:hypothetical protein
MNSNQGIAYAGIYFATDHIAEINGQQPTLVVPISSQLLYSTSDLKMAAREPLN